MGRAKWSPEDLESIAQTTRVAVLDRIERSSEDQKERGHRWYFEGHMLARDTAEHDGHSLEAACGMIAALSPQITWERNVAAFLEFSARGRTKEGILPLSRQRAWRCYKGEDPLVVLGGPKTRAFYWNLLDPWHSRAITFDTLMCQIAGIWPYPSYWPKGEYEAREKGVRLVAADHGWLGHQAQAVAWLQLREESSARRRALERLPSPV